jgi:hypothetical protein
MTREMTMRGTGPIVDRIPTIMVKAAITTTHGSLSNLLLGGSEDS